MVIRQHSSTPVSSACRWKTTNPLAFAAYPVVVRIGGSEYVRSIQKVNPDHSLSFIVPSTRVSSFHGPMA